MGKPILIGTRGSKLALWQAEWVKKALLKLHPHLSIEINKIKTRGDKILDVPLAKIGGKGLFVKEIEEALLNGRIDIAVHSMKDMPATLPPGLCIGAIPKRETPYDVLISKEGKALSELKRFACIGTSSLRRASQLCGLRPDVRISPLRGNLDTRLKKLETDQLDAIVLAAAGVKRMGLEDRVTQYLPENVMLPAVGQGALCIETRKKDQEVDSKISSLEHVESRMAVTAERAFLHRLEGGCQVPIAAYAKVEVDTLKMSGLVASLDGTTIIRDTTEGPLTECRRIGIDLAERLISLGAGNILENLKTDLSAEHEND